MDRMWAWRMRAFCMRSAEGVPRAWAAGYWGVCAQCRPLFEKREYYLLTARVCTLHPHTYDPADLEALYCVVGQVTYGKRVFWKEGDDYDAMFQIPPPTEMPSLYVIYDHPRDFPDHWVVRVWHGEIPRGDGVLFDSLEEARASLPPGATNLHREPGDDSAIAECWV